MVSNKTINPLSKNNTTNSLSKKNTKNIFDKLKNIFMVLLLIVVCGYVIYLVFIQNIDQNSIYGIVALIGITVMILLNILKFITNRESKYIWRIIFYLFISLFAALLFINQESIQKCLSEDQKTSFMVYTMILLSVYLYLYKERSLADCSYLSFSKILMILSSILSFIHNMNETLVICLILIFYMNT
tara:strand:+ start:105 stop:665 length:561 start_codon:yes stop_codon:yes gene_type:complete